METMKYSFYGGDNPAVAALSPITNEYKGIGSPMDLYRDNAPSPPFWCRTFSGEKCMGFPFPAVSSTALI